MKHIVQATASGPSSTQVSPWGPLLISKMKSYDLCAFFSFADAEPACPLLAEIAEPPLLLLHLPDITNIGCCLPLLEAMGLGGLSILCLGKLNNVLIWNTKLYHTSIRRCAANEGQLCMC